MPRHERPEAYVADSLSAGAPAVDPTEAGPVPDELSPELVLVTPESQLEARLDLPERPWERAAPASRGPVDVAGAARGGGVPSPTERRVDDGPGTGGRPRRFLVPALVLGAVIVTGLLVGAASRTGVWDARSGGGAVGPAPATVPPVLLPTSGYVVSPAGSFMTDRTGHSITSFTLPIRCGSSPVVIENVPVADRTLHVTRKAVGRSVTVRLTVRALGRERARGVVATSAPGCNRQVAFVARLS